MPPEGDAAAGLVCPADRGALVSEESALRCAACGNEYPVVEGIPDFVSTAGPSTARWLAAQRYELDYWAGRGPKALAETRGHFTEAARGLEQIFDGASDTWRDRVVHVGPAGLGEIHAIDARERWAVEPLAIALARRGLLERGDVRWAAAMGERLPFADDAFSAAIVPNVIDHVADPPALLRELRRCLRPGAPAWLTSHVVTPLAAPALRILARTRLGYFAGHPFAFTPGNLRALAADAGFRVVREQATGVERAGGPRDALKSLVLGVRYLLLRAP